MRETSDSTAALLASRKLDCHDPDDPSVGHLTIGLFAPRHNGSEWECVLRFEREGHPPLEQAIYGVDSMQAFLLALQTIDAFLDSYRHDGLELTWLGDSELRFYRRPPPRRTSETFRAALDSAPYVSRGLDMVDADGAEATCELRFTVPIAVPVDEDNRFEPWLSRVSLVWDGGSQHWPIPGMDAVDALSRGFDLARVIVPDYAKHRGWTLSWLGDDALGLPGLPPGNAPEIEAYEAEFDLPAIASRALLATHADGSISTVMAEIAAPESHESDGVGWTCALRVTGTDEDWSDAFGMDAFDALYAALDLVAIKLKSGVPQDTQLTWLDDPDLGFPPPSPDCGGYTDA